MILFPRTNIVKEYLKKEKVSFLSSELNQNRTIYLSHLSLLVEKGHRQKPLLRLLYALFTTKNSNEGDDSPMIIYDDLPDYSDDMYLHGFSPS